MAKISALPRIAPGEADGTELLPVVRDGTTKAAPVADFIAPAAQPFVDAAEAASLTAQMAKEQITDLVKPENIFVDVALATAEASLAEASGALAPTRLLEPNAGA